MVLLVTGGAGFIGSHFLRYWVTHHPGDRVLCLDALTYAANMHNLEDCLSRIRFVYGDVADALAVDALFARIHPDVVVHFAAESHVDRSITAPDVFVRTNVLGTQVLLDAARRYGVARFHLVSTDEVYGDTALEEKRLFDESAVLRPSSPYAASKAAADLLALAYRRTYGLPVTLSRCGNNYGPCQFPEKLIPLCICRAQDDQAIPLYGKGENVRDWIAVQDHCVALDIILQRGQEGEIYNVGAGQWRSNREVVGSILRALGKPDTLIEQVPDRAGHDLRYALDASKLRALGWAPTVAFDEGLAETVRWYVEHRDWVQTVTSGAYLKDNRRWM